MADTDPLEYRQRSHPDLEVESHGLTLWDLDREFATGSFGGEGRRFMKLRDILGILRDSYCRTTGIEYMHIMDPEQRRWIQERVERPHIKPPREEQLRILLKLNQAEAFETFLQTKFVGQKRFSLEGGETTIPLLDEICEAAAEAGLDEVTMGMAHRGRLNVLANIVGKKYSQIFREFEGNIDPRTVQGSGDVKYHLGAEGEFVAGNGDRDQGLGRGEPVAPRGRRPGARGHRAGQAGRPGPRAPTTPCCRCWSTATRRSPARASSPRPSTCRSCAATAPAARSTWSSTTRSGFTTSPGSSRSSLYCTDVARMVQAPIFHVNGDDPEACIRVARLAFEYRQAFNKDVVIDLVCYRRRGHNEGDDPSYTQPLMYDLIEQKRSVRKLYTESLIGRGDITIEEAEQVLQATTSSSWSGSSPRCARPTGADRVDHGARLPREAGRHRRDRGRPEVLKRIADAYVTPPEGFTVHPKVMPQLQRRAERHRRRPDRLGHRRDPRVRLAADGRPAGAPGRPGQPARHVRVPVRHDHRPRQRRRVDAADGNLTEDQAKFYVYDSLLSEYAALGLRVRLLRRASRRAGALGGPVRRLRRTARRASSTSSSPPARPSGASSPASCCCSRTATRARAPTTPRPASSGG